MCEITHQKVRPNQTIKRRRQENFASKLDDEYKVG